jgi:hypothetical protein
MTVSELIEELKKYPADMPVYASHDVDEIEVASYGCSTLETYVYIRGVRKNNDK